MFPLVSNFGGSVNLPQYQIMVRTLAALQMVYRVGTAGSKLCDGRFSEPRIVPPCQEAYQCPLCLSSRQNQAMVKSHPGMERGIPTYLMVNSPYVNQKEFFGRRAAELRQQLFACDCFWACRVWAVHQSYILPCKGSCILCQKPRGGTPETSTKGQKAPGKMSCGWKHCE